MTHVARHALAALALAAALAPGAALPFANAKVGDRVPDAALKSTDGKRQPMLDPEHVTLFAFVQPGQPQSLKTLEIFAALQRDVGSRPIRIVAVVSDSARGEERRALARVAAPVPILVDAGDRVSGAIGAFTFPSIGFAGPDHRLVSNEVFTTVGLRDALRDRIDALVPPPAPPLVARAVAAPEPRGEADARGAAASAAAPSPPPERTPAVAAAAIQPAPPPAPASTPPAVASAPAPRAEPPPAAVAKARATWVAAVARAPAPSVASGPVVVEGVFIQRLEPVGAQRAAAPVSEAPALPPVADPED